jgi:hypothetical protein
MDPTNDLCELAKTRETTASSVRGRASGGQLDRLARDHYRLAGRLISRLHGGPAAIYSS